jgi:hypothetical protein
MLGLRLAIASALFTSASAFTAPAGMLVRCLMINHIAHAYMYIFRRWFNEVIS